MSSWTPGRGARRFGGDEGASLVEYALLVALIAVVCISAITYFQAETSKSLSESASAIN
jgi:Flp pilus assembly pilin Flp